MHRTLSPAGAFWLAAFTYFIWGFTFLASRIAQDYGTPFVLLFWRFALAFALLNLLRLTGRFPVRLRGRRLWPVLLAGLFEPVLYFPCEQYGLKLTSTSFSGVMVALIPLCSLVYGALFLQEKATWRQVVFSVLSVAGVIVLAVYATGIGAAAVWNIENETFVYEHNADAALAPASLVKLMTAVCAYEVLGDRMDETLTVEYSMIAAASGNQVGYYVGETVTVRDLFGGLLTRGANDCAYLLAYAADGGTDAFVARMNEKAAALGMDATVYKNPTGMNAEGAVTTARDAVRIAEAFNAIPALTALSGQR